MIWQVLFDTHDEMLGYDLEFYNQVDFVVRTYQLPEFHRQRPDVKCDSASLQTVWYTLHVLINYREAFKVIGAGPAQCF